MRFLLAQINPTIGALDHNKSKILQAIERGKKEKVDLVIFPEMALTGYPPEDLLLLPHFIKAVDEALQEIVSETSDIAIVLGYVRENPLKGEKKLFNSAAFIENGKVLKIHDKVLLPEYDVFSERRYFEPSQTVTTVDFKGKKAALTICEDMWQHAKAVIESSYPRDPISDLEKEGCDFFINISASPFYPNRQQTRLKIAQEVQKTLKTPILFCNQVGGNDSLIFDGKSFYLDLKGKLTTAKAFEEDFLFIDSAKENQEDSASQEPIEELFLALSLGLKDYFEKIGFKKALIGISGGIDSAVAAVILKETLGKEYVSAFFLPSRFTSKESEVDAKLLVKNLGLELQEISIEPIFATFLSVLNPHFEGKPWDITEENLQARIRGMIMMAFSNKCGGILINTANKSELATGYSTLYGDMCGGISLLGDVSKTNVYQLARWINRKEKLIPERILSKAPTAELRLNQRDSDTLPLYDVLDTVLEGYIENHLSEEEIAKKNQLDLSLVKDIVKKIHFNEYKRRQAPMSFRVTKKAFSFGRRFPIVQRWR